MTEKNYPGPCGVDISSLTIVLHEKKKIPLNNLLSRLTAFWIPRAVTLFGFEMKGGASGKQEGWEHSIQGWCYRNRHGQIHMKGRGWVIFHSWGAVKNSRKSQIKLLRSIPAQSWLNIGSMQSFEKPLSSKSFYDEIKCHQNVQPQLHYSSSFSSSLLPTNPSPSLRFCSWEITF